MNHQLQKTIQNLQQEINNTQNNNWTTNCQLPTPHNTTINIQTTTNITQLLETAAHITNLHTTYNNLIQQLHINAPQYQYHNNTPQNWIHDIKKRINQLNLPQKQQQLKALQNQLQQ